MLNIKSYQDFAKFLEKKLKPQGTVFAVGVTAFMRFFPGLFLKNFKVRRHTNTHTHTHTDETHSLSMSSPADFFLVPCHMDRTSFLFV